MSQSDYKEKRKEVLAEIEEIESNEDKSIKDNIRLSALKLQLRLLNSLIKD